MTTEQAAAQGEGPWISRPVGRPRWPTKLEAARPLPRETGHPIGCGEAAHNIRARGCDAGRARAPRRSFTVRASSRRWLILPVDLLTRIRCHLTMRRIVTLFRSHVRDQPMRCLSSLAVLLTLSAPTGAQVPARAKPNEEAKFRAALTKVLGGREKSAYAIAFVTETRDVAREGASLIGLGIDVMIAPLQGAIWLNAGPNPPITTPFPLSRFTAKMIGSPNAPEYQVEIKVFADRKSAVEAITKHVQGPREGWKDVKTWSLVKRTDRVVIASQAADKEQARLGALAKKGAKLKVQRAPGPGK